MSTGPKLVHKQFNSPMGLYSQQNIQETLNKHIHNLDNGATGIDFNDPATGKPANLANSAVLRMLEEEERQRRGHPKLDPTQVQAILDTLTHANHRFDTCWPPERGARLTSAKSWEGELDKSYHFAPGSHRAVPADQKKVVWPPAPETNGYHQPQLQQQHSSFHQQPAYYNGSQQSPSAPQYQHPSPRQPPAQKHPQQQYAPEQQFSQPQQQQFSQQQQQYSQPQQQLQYPQSRSAYCEGHRQEQPAINRLIPVGPGVTPSPYRPGPLSPQAASAHSPRSQQNSRWGPVASPASPQASPTYQQPSYAPQQQQQYAPQQQQHAPQQQHYAPQQQQFSPQQQQYSPQPQQQQQYAPQQHYQPQPQFEPPPTTVTLRQHTPIHQKPSPVFTSQPAAASFQGGANMRGDQKWPPQSVKEAVAAENEARRQLAKGPACRPRRVRKDYTAFFAQNALNSTYPGYRIPPGTQHIEDNSGRTSF